MAVPDDETKEKATAFLTKLMSLARLPKQTEVLVIASDFVEAISQSPRADLTIFGLSKEPDLVFVQELVQKVNGSCVFVRDSGDESALA